MPSLQSRIVRFAMARMNVFGKPGDSPQKIRQQVENTSRWFGTPAGVSVEKTQAGGVPGEWIVPQGAPADQALLYLHGGAWFFGSPNTHRALVARITLSARLRALVLDYRLAPEHPYPAGLDDCLSAYRWLLSNGFPARSLAIAGDSAGGSLTLGTLLALRDGGEPLPAVAACISPCTDMAGSLASRRTRAAVDPIFREADVSGIAKMYLRDVDPCTPLVSPLYGDLRGLPPLLIHVGEDEILLDDATTFAERARSSGVDASVVVWPGMWHVFQVYAGLMPEGRDSLQQIGAFLRQKISAADMRE